MKQILSTDTLHASAAVMGRTFFAYTGTGVNSLRELINMVCQCSGAPTGMVSLRVHNASQGWADNSDFYLSA